MKLTPIQKMCKLADDNQIIVMAFTKEDAEKLMDRKITNEHWQDTVREFDHSNSYANSVAWDTIMDCIPDDRLDEDDKI